jgi:hypothetical protein
MDHLGVDKKLGSKKLPVGPTISRARKNSNISESNREGSRSSKKNQSKIGDEPFSGTPNKSKLESEEEEESEHDESSPK